MAEPSKPYIGGQAVIEGVMMRAPRGVSIAVRRPGGAIAVREGPHKSKVAKSPLGKVPGVRGVLTMVEALTLGWDALKFSAEQQMTDEERAESQGSSGRGAIMISTIIALLVFMALPQALAAGTARYVLGLSLGVQDWRFHLLTGGFKLSVFALYLLAISRIPDVRRLFQYHGAEHKTIFAHEAELPLTVDNVRKQSTLHPRCGTTFLVMVVIISILLGSVTTPLLLPNVTGFVGQLLTLGLRILLLPFVAALSFELQRLSARYCTRGPLRVLLYPGFLFQKITTREPDDSQMEIAIAAMRSAIWRQDVAGDRELGDEPLVFESFEAFDRAAGELRPLPELQNAA